MVVFARGIVSLAFFESKRDSITFVHPYAEVSSSVALQRFESVSCGQPEVLKTARLVDRIELPTDHRP